MTAESQSLASQCLIYSPYKMWMWVRLGGCVNSSRFPVQYKGKSNKPLPQVARELNVDAIVEEDHRLDAAALRIGSV